MTQFDSQYRLALKHPGMTLWWLNRDRDRSRYCQARREANQIRSAEFARRVRPEFHWVDESGRASVTETLCGTPQYEVLNG